MKDLIVDNPNLECCRDGERRRTRSHRTAAALATGVVRTAEPHLFTGNTVVIDHGVGRYSLLAHLSQFNVKQGDRVRRGHIVGCVGAMVASRARICTGAYA